MTIVAGEPAHLLIVQLGPVQDFIVQARRTRDLWFGSHLLSELSRAAARAAATVGALIFPALGRDDPELMPCDTVARDSGPPLSIANKIVVEVRAGADPRDAAQTVRAAIAARWRAIASEVRTMYEADLADDIDAVWNEQIDTLVEYVAAWAPIDRPYPAARRKVEDALGGRRRLRDFAAIEHHRDRAPASSLDGGRVSVLAPPETRRARRAERRLLLGDGESLDAVGVVKRRGGAPDQFLSVVHVAVVPWLRRAAASPTASPLLAALRDACRALTVEDRAGVERRLDRISRPDLPGAAIFPYNASVLFAPRLPSVFEELGATKDLAAIKARAWEQNLLRPLLAAAGEPYPYVACLVADGDRMGRAIESLSTPDAHRTLARELGTFPAVARRIVEQEHDGIAVFAGGDDVLAFVPVCRAVACAESLRTAFASAVGEALTRARAVDRANGHAAIGDDQAVPSLSVGVGIGHVLDGLGYLCELGRRAERAAKAPRNALAFVVDRRSGGDHEWCASWQEDPAERLARDLVLLSATVERPARLPMGKVHELARLLRATSVPAAATIGRPGDRAAQLEAVGGASMLRGEITRILARTHLGAAPPVEPQLEEAPGGASAAVVRALAPRGITPDDVGLHLKPEASFLELYLALAAWIARIQIAHVLASSEPSQGHAEPPRTTAVTSTVAEELAR